MEYCELVDYCELYDIALLLLLRMMKMMIILNIEQTKTCGSFLFSVIT